jgi:predicted dehydrogenase
MSSVLRAGVVGLGAMGRNHVRALGSIDGVAVVGAFDIDPGSPVGPGPVTIHRSMDALIDQGLDLCVVAVPTDAHEAIGLQLARAGVPTLIEKPLAADVEGGARLVAAFTGAGLAAGVGHIERHNPAIASMHSRLSAGALGQVYQITTSRQGPFPGRIRDVGVVKDLGTHDLDLAAWIAGSPYVSVAAQTAHRAGRPHEDLVAVVGRLADGTVTNHLVNWLSPVKERRVVVTGERGCFSADMLTSDLTFFANASVPSAWSEMARFRGVSEGDMIRYAIAKPEPLVVELEQFVAAVRGRPSSTVSLEEGLEVLVVAEAALRSAATGTVVEVAR